MFSWREQQEGLNDMLRDVQLIVETKLKLKSSNPNSPFIYSQDESRTYIHLCRGYWLLDLKDWMGVVRDSHKPTWHVMGSSPRGSNAPILNLLAKD